MLDIIVDIREGSETFLKYELVELSEENKKMVFIPSGFAHGFITLKDESQLIYHHTAMYKPEYENGIHYKDPLIKLNLPFEVKVISEKDLNIPYKDHNFKGI